MVKDGMYAAELLWAVRAAAKTCWDASLHVDGCGECMRCYTLAGNQRIYLGEEFPAPTETQALSAAKRWEDATEEGQKELAALALARLTLTHDAVLSSENPGTSSPEAERLFSLAVEYLELRGR